MYNYVKNREFHIVIHMMWITIFIIVDNLCKTAIYFNSYPHMTPAQHLQKNSFGLKINKYNRT